jgi:hypothetical protein
MNSPDKYGLIKMKNCMNIPTKKKIDDTTINDLADFAKHKE